MLTVFIVFRSNKCLILSELSKLLTCSIICVCPLSKYRVK